jgi:hypothetical protein
MARMSDAPRPFMWKGESRDQFANETPAVDALDWRILS